MRSLRRALVALGVAGFLFGAMPLALSFESSHLEDRTITAVFGPLVGWAYIGVGLFAWYRRPENRFGMLMTAVGFAWCLSGLAAADAPGVFIVGYMAAPLSYAILIHMLLAFPSGRLGGRADRVIVALGYFISTVLQYAATPFDDTARSELCGGCPPNPLLVEGHQGVANTLTDLQILGALAGICGMFVVLVRRWRRTAPSQRGLMTPVLFSGALLLGLLAVTLVADMTGISDDLEAAVDASAVVTMAAIPFAFVGGLMRTRFSRAAAVGDLVQRLSEREDRRGTLREALAEALGDPCVQVVYWLGERGVYVDAQGRHFEPGQDGRACTPVESAGERVGAIVHDPALGGEHELVRAIGAAAAITIQNERLDAELRARLEELSDSRTRLLRMGLEERRRLERDLHDGAQQRLVSLALHLRLARDRVHRAPGEAEEMLLAASSELEAALAELRELARGIHPAVLSDRGLPAALEALAARAPVPVEVETGPEGRLPEPVEAAAYFVAAEALTNVARYAHAGQARVRVSRDNGHVVVEVADDGVGGAEPDNGSGLRGLAERLSAIDGRLEVTSTPGAGTIVRADIPCG